MGDSEQVQRYMALAEQRIGGAFVAEGLYVHLAGGIQGPHTLTFGIRLYQPTAANVGRALRLAPAIEAAIGDGPARVYTERGAVFVEVPSPWPANIPGAELQGRGLAVPLGITSRRQVAGIDFETCPHALILGPTGRGKTTAMRAIAYQLARQNRPSSVGLVAITAKPPDWQAFARIAHTWAVIADPGEASAALAWLRDTMGDRARLGARWPAIFAFVDDLLNLLALADVAGPLAELASLGRAAGVHLVLGTQRLGKRGAGDVAITGNIPTRLVFGTADAQDAAYFTGRSDAGAERLGRYPGDALLVSDGSAQRLAVGRVTDQDLGELAQDAREWRPWLENRVEPAHMTPHDGPEGEISPLLEPATTRLPWRRPSPEDAARLRALYAELRSKNAVMRAAWGGKNGQLLAWLDEALAGGTQ